MADSWSSNRPVGSALRDWMAGTRMPSAADFAPAYAGTREAVAAGERDVAGRSGANYMGARVRQGANVAGQAVADTLRPANDLAEQINGLLPFGVRRPNTPVPGQEAVRAFVAGLTGAPAPIPEARHINQDAVRFVDQMAEPRHFMQDARQMPAPAPQAAAVASLAGGGPPRMPAVFAGGAPVNEPAYQRVSAERRAGQEMPALEGLTNREAMGLMERAIMRPPGQRLTGADVARGRAIAIIDRRQEAAEQALRNRSLTPEQFRQQEQRNLAAIIALVGNPANLATADAMMGLD